MSPERLEPKAPRAGAADRAPKAGPAAGDGAKAPRRWFHRVDPLTSLFLVMPLYLIYQVGVLAQMRCAPGVGCTWVRNGVDFVTGTVLQWTNGSRLTFGAIALSVGAVLMIAVLWARKREKLHPKLFVPVLLESLVYASVVGPLIIYVQGRLPMGAPGSSSFLGDIVASCGAGLHEELIFRAGLFAGGVWLLKRVGIPVAAAVVVSLLASSTLFSLVHHLGPLGDPFSARVFIFRLLAGVLFGVIYRVRGFAIAAWTHTIYDIWVFALQRAS